MQRFEHLHGRTQLFIFDLEFIGDVRRLNTCRIWEIAVYSVSTQKWFTRVVDPDPTADIFQEPPIPEIPRLTRDFLTKHNAVMWDIACAELILWIRAQTTGGSVPVFVSHNTFRADKPIMELESRRFAMRLPLEWYFFDSLHFARASIRNPSGNYSLSGLYQQMFHTEIKNVHRARSDVMACIRILSHLTHNAWCLVGPMYPTYATSLRSVRWIGRKAEQLLYLANIRSVEDLFTHIHHNIRNDYIVHSISEDASVRKTLGIIFKNELPEDNIANITTVINGMRAIRPYSYTFMIMQH